jgi:hypothetical protein
MPASDARIVIALHGLDRAAAAFQDALAPAAEKNAQIVLVPEFDAVQFPDVHAYNYGGVRRPPPDGPINARPLWNCGLIERLFAVVRTAVGSARTTFGIFGNSAGSQFVLRYLALMEASQVDVAVASNSGWYMLPDLTISYPIGMAGLDPMRPIFVDTLDGASSCCWVMPIPTSTRSISLATTRPWPRDRTAWRVAFGTSSIAGGSPKASARRSGGNCGSSKLRGMWTR